jgi:hypothetical protein
MFRSDEVCEAMGTTDELGEVVEGRVVTARNPEVKKSE